VTPEQLQLLHDLLSDEYSKTTNAIRRKFIKETDVALTEALKEALVARAIRKAAGTA